MKRKDSRSKKKFFQIFMSIGLPLVIQQFLTSSLNFLDNVMMGKLGAEYIAGVGFANNIYRIQDICLFGICGGIGVFISQYHGKKDYVIIKKLIGGMFIAATLLSLLIIAVSQGFSHEIISLFSKDKTAVSIGVSYLELVSVSYLFSAMGFALAFSLRCIGKTKIPMISAGVGVLINGILNYILIYGKLGIDPMYERGAALATIIARVIQLAVVVILIKEYDYGIKGKLKEYMGLSKNIIKEITKVATPIFFTEVFWILGTVALSVAYSRIGIGEAASVQISELVFSIAAIIFMGLSNATSIIIGKSIGEGKKQLATLYSGKALRLALFCALFSVAVIQLLVKPILSLYTLTPEVYTMALYTLRVFGAVIFFKLLNWTILVGILRAGGDTKIAFYLDTLPLYIYAIPAAFICGYLKMPIYVVVAIVNMEEVVKFGLALKRYASMKWLNDLTVSR